MRFDAKNIPAIAPRERIASTAYCEQVGVKRQPAVGPKRKICAGEIVQRYARITETKMCWNRFKLILV